MLSDAGLGSSMWGRHAPWSRMRVELELPFLHPQTHLPQLPAPPTLPHTPRGSCSHDGSILVPSAEIPLPSSSSPAPLHPDSLSPLFLHQLGPHFLKEAFLDLPGYIISAFHCSLGLSACLSLPADGSFSRVHPGAYSPLCLQYQAWLPGSTGNTV